MDNKDGTPHRPVCSGPLELDTNPPPQQLKRNRNKALKWKPLDLSEKKKTQGTPKVKPQSGSRPTAAAKLKGGKRIKPSFLPSLYWFILNQTRPVTPEETAQDMRSQQQEQQNQKVNSWLQLTKAVTTVWSQSLTSEGLLRFGCCQDYEWNNQNVNAITGSTLV